MLIHLLRMASATERARLAEFLIRSRKQRHAADAAWVRERMDAYACLDYAQQVAHALAGAALHEYDAVYARLPESRDKQFIEALATWVLERR